MDWGSFSYVGEDGRKRRKWGFVMVLSWSKQAAEERVLLAGLCRLE